MRSAGADRSLALAVLAEELQGLRERFEEITALTDTGERNAHIHDLMRTLDRYIRLEAEVFLSVLTRTGFDDAGGRRGHKESVAYLDRASGRGGFDCTVARATHCFRCACPASA